MSIVRITMLSLLLAASIVSPLLIRRHAQARLKVLQDRLSRESIETKRFALENEMLSNIVAKARGADALSAAEWSELLRLRSELAPLRSSLQQTNQLASEIRRMREGIQEMAGQNEGDRDATALLEDQRELRLARVTKLQEWLKGRPEETIPELKLLSEESWLRSADRTRVTDEEFQGWMSAQRGNAEMKFGQVLFKAVKQFVAANGGQFPTDVAQLKPFFATPVEDAMIERYEVVPAQSLANKFLAQAGGDWVITEKAPVNKDFDTRMAVSASDCRGTVEAGRWDRAR